MQNTGSNRQPPAPSTTETGLVEFFERKETRAGKPMLTLKINQKDVSFFEETDVQKEIAIGDQVQFQCTVKGQYLNGKVLQCLHKGMPNSQAALPTKKPQIPASPNNPPTFNANSPSPNSAIKNSSNPRPMTMDRSSLQIHNLNADQLTQLYAQFQAEGKSEPAFLGQISNQIRYARIEEMLRELIVLLKKH